MRDHGRVSLLADIQNAATDPSRSLSDLLRMCQILAFRLRHEPFKAWVSHELGGYPDDERLPDYRGAIVGEIMADLLGFGGAASSIGVPLTNIPEEIRERAVQFKFFQGVAMLEGIVADAARTGETRIRSPFSTELAALTPVWKGYQTIAMWLEVPVASIVGILDAVRTRALAFTLEIEAENPEAGTTTTTEPPVPLVRIDNIFNTAIYGGNVAVGPGAQVKVTPGDLGSLMAYLEAQGVIEADRRELETALAADNNSLGDRVKGWLGTMVAKTASFGATVAGNAAGGLIATAVLRYLGMG
jgi:AbiTii